MTGIINVKGKKSSALKECKSQCLFKPEKPLHISLQKKEVNRFSKVSVLYLISNCSIASNFKISKNKV
jgi:hypothetical protein